MSKYDLLMCLKAFAYHKVHGKVYGRILGMKGPHYIGQIVNKVKKEGLF